ncbi:LamG-like jellyroll fold domain-containing protein [Barnesiella viscericola]|uniref:LamG-like jellyroll fold domain-containing protein n=1 Tax=Barnesiella viscericola TaxID=397865 RepID=UPI0023560B5B|nr:LamG-like jellyroll fold domain-containing protein [Barnesiella viscericola]
MIFTSLHDIAYNGSHNEGTYYDVKITVKNNIQKYAINFTAPENGTLSIKNGANAVTPGEEIAEGTILTVSASPNSGYELVAVKNNGEIFPNSTYAVTAAANFTAEFKQLATEGDAMLMSAPGYGSEEAQLRFSDTVLGSHNTSENQVSSDQRSRNYTFSAWISPMGYNGVFMGHVQNSITWAVEGSYGIGVQDGKLAVWYRYWDGSTTGCPGASAPAVSETTTLYPGEFAFITLVTSNDGKNFKVYKNGEEAISQDVEQGGLALLYDACDFAIGDSKYNQMASKVEEVQLWNRTLTTEEIQASMYGYNEMPEGLVAYYRPESATGTTVENLAGEVDAYYRANNRSGNSGEFPVATNIQKTNGRETVEVTYNTPEEENAAYTLQRYGAAIAASPAPVKVYSNLYAVNGSDSQEISSVTVNGSALENVTDPIQVATSPVTVEVAFSVASGIEEVAAEAIYYNNNVLYMPEGATAVVYNLLGTAVAEVAEPAADLAQLPAGIYLAKVSKEGNHTIIRFKK